MRRVTVVFAALVLAMGIGSIGHGEEISLTEYEVPISSMEDLYVSFVYDYNDGPVDDEGLDKTADDVTDKGRLSVVYSTFHESLPFGYAINVTGIGARDGDAAEVYTHDLTGSIRGKKYFPRRREDERNDAFGYGKLTASSATPYDNVASTVSIGLGYGRFINATPLARAIRIQEELGRENALKSPVPKEALLKLAMLLTSDKQEEYRARHKEVWEKYYLEAIEEVLVQSGAIQGDRLGAVPMVRIREVLDEVVHDRYYGFELSGGVGYELTQPYSEMDKDPVGELNVKYARPVGIRTQITEIVTVTTPFTDILGKESSLLATTSLSYEATRQVDLIASYLFNADNLRGEGNFELNHSLNAGCVLYTEGRSSISITGSLHKAEGDEEITKALGTTVSYKIF